MRDRNKLNSGQLRVNALEEQELCKHVTRLKRHTSTVVTDIDAEQTKLARKFLRFLDTSASLAKQHENTIRSFNLRKATLSEVKQDNRRARKSAGILGSDSESDASLRDDDCDLKQTAGTRFSSTFALRQKNDNFRVPYKRTFSYKTNELSKSAPLLDMRSKMWQRVVYCVDRGERAKSAPVLAGKYVAPARVHIAHTRALKLLGMSEAVTYPPSYQPQIDRDVMWKLRKGEIEAEKQAVQQFVDGLKPFRLKPGPSQDVLDANQLYGELSRLNRRCQRCCYTAN